MDMAQALQECAQLLALSAAALRRLSDGQTGQQLTPRATQLLEEVSQIAAQLERLGTLIEATARSDGAEVRALFSSVPATISVPH